MGLKAHLLTLRVRRKDMIYFNSHGFLNPSTSKSQMDVIYVDSLKKIQKSSDSLCPRARGRCKKALNLESGLGFSNLFPFFFIG